ncbi:MAG: serine/threonine protein kinase [Proteobacteria bacterium]|nr:serine/threonine protein kinase [Pseudomonadota bacterium]
MDKQEIRKNSTYQHEQADGYVSYEGEHAEPVIETPEELRGRYEFVCPIGKGSQGNVFKAIRCSDHQPVAIKMLNIDSVPNWKDYELFHRESEVLKSLNMPGIAGFYESMEFLDQKKPRAYIVQEYIDGSSLAELANSGYRFTVNRIFEMAGELLDLLEKLHHHNPPVIHRDLKPANIMYRRTGEHGFQLYLVDFGAVANPMVQGGGSTIAGTYGYMPPEQLMGRPVPASDIYALGATLVYLLCGVDPAQIQVKDFRLIIEPHLEQMPQAVVELLRQMLDPKAESRLCDYQKLKRTFDDFSRNRFVFESGVRQTSGDMMQKLENVEYYAQPGNMDLWAALDDHVPRELPFPMGELKQSPLLSTRSVKRRFPFFKVGIAAFFLIILNIILGGVFNIGGVFNLISLATLPLCFFVLWICLLLGSLAFRRIRKPRFKFSDDDEYNLKMLLKYGQKSIATVTEVQYLPNDVWYVEDYELGNEQAYCYHGLPSFKMKYKFNPVDDANPYDLNHSIIIHDDPGESLQPGSPIPILYAVDPNDKYRVISMPYPFPMKKVVALKELFYLG